MTFLQHFGQVLRQILHIGIEVAAAAEPIVDLAVPSVALIYNTAVGLALAEEATAATVTGSGPEKLASLVAKLLPLGEQFAADNNLVFDHSKVDAWASLIADSLNKFPFTLVPAAAPAK